jgi:hypothetical protein
VSGLGRDCGSKPSGMSVAVAVMPAIERDPAPKCTAYKV